MYIYRYVRICGISVHVYMYVCMYVLYVCMYVYMYAMAYLSFGFLSLW